MLALTPLLYEKPPRSLVVERNVQRNPQVKLETQVTYRHRSSSQFTELPGQ